MILAAPSADSGAGTLNRTKHQAGSKSASVRVLIVASCGSLLGHHCPVSHRFCLHTNSNYQSIGYIYFLSKAYHQWILLYCILYEAEYVWSLLRCLCFGRYFWIFWYLFLVHSVFRNLSPVTGYVHFRLLTSSLFSLIFASPNTYFSTYRSLAHHFSCLLM